MYILFMIRSHNILHLLVLWTCIDSTRQPVAMSYFKIQSEVLREPLKQADMAEKRAEINERLTHSKLVADNYACMLWMYRFPHGCISDSSYTLANLHVSSTIHRLGHHHSKIVLNQSF